jgi:hypothetical protein
VTYAAPRRPFVAALVTVDEEALLAWAEANGKDGVNLEDLIDDPDLVTSVQTAIDEANKPGRLDGSGAIFPALAAWRRAARATAPQKHQGRQGPDRALLRSAIFPALAAWRRAARATAPQNTKDDRDRIAPYCGASVSGANRSMAFPSGSRTVA